MPDTKKQELIRKLIKDRSIHTRSPNLDFEKQMEVRKIVLSKLIHAKFRYINNPVFNIEVASTKHCENLIGKIEVPLGIAGPLKIKGDYARGNFFIPLATTEGALVASVNRGCKAITKSGGAYAFIERYGMTRAPLFHTKNLEESRIFVKFIETHFEKISEIVRKTDPYSKLQSIKSYIAGRNVYLRFNFDTADAMGMNMVTIACEKVIKDYIERKTAAKCITLSGNMCTDKKASWINKIEGRGYSVHAEVTIPKSIVKNVLKTDPVKFVDVLNRKNLLGSAFSGSIGFNAHHANIIAAIFLATGQDMAHVSESSSGLTLAEADGNDLYVSVSLPDLPVGTVGGGMGLETQKEALSILGVEGGGIPPGSNAKKFAEIIGACVLAGELSLISALQSGDLAKAHQKLGR